MRAIKWFAAFAAGFLIAGLLAIGYEENKSTEVNQTPPAVSSQQSP